MFVAAAGRADELVVAPDFDPVPGERVEADLDDLAAEIDGGLPQPALQAEGGVQAHPALDPGKEEALPVGLGIGGAQVEGALGEALGRGLALQGAVRSLVVFAFDPAPEPGVEFFQASDRVDGQAGLKVHLEGAKPPLLLSLGPGRVGLGVAEAHIQVGAHDPQMMAGEDFALVGVELLGEAAAGQPVAEAVQKPAQLFRVVILGVRDQTRTVVDQREEPGLDGLAAGRLDDGAVHHVGHPQLVGQGALEGLGRAAGGGRKVPEGTDVQLVGGQQAVDRGQAEGAGVERPLPDELPHQDLDLEMGMFAPPLQNRLAGFRAQRLAGALVLARPAVKGLKSLVAQKIIPALQGGGRIGFAAPGPFAGQDRGPGQCEVLL